MAVYDVAVVGAGPAGLGACLKAASLGLKTALVERRSRLSPIRRACSEGLLYEEPYNGDAIRVNREQGRIEFVNSGFSLRYTGPVREVPYFANISWRGHWMKIVRDDRKAIHLVFDKGRYLEENLEDAVKAGVSYFPDRTVVDLDQGKQGITIRTDKDTVQARFLIAADGHNSVCTRIAGFNRERQFYGTLTGTCWHIAGACLEDDGHIHLVEGKDDPDVFCMCPRVDDGEYSVMLSGFSPGRRYDERFEQVRQSSILAPIFKKGITVQRELSCVLNLFEPLASPCRDAVFVVGDAAWLGQTSNSHASLTGARAAACIADILQNRCSADEGYAGYRAWWVENFINYAKVPGGGNIFEELSRDEVDELFTYMPAEIPGSMEPRKAKQLMGALFQKLVPEIMQKNPALVQRIMTIQQKTVDDAWAEKRKQGTPVRQKIRKTASP
jgi:flavin-dependent dehydrogenase